MGDFRFKYQLGPRSTYEKKGVIKERILLILSGSNPWGHVPLPCTSASYYYVMRVLLALYGYSCSSFVCDDTYYFLFWPTVIRF